MTEIKEMGARKTKKKTVCQNEQGGAVNLIA